LMPLSSYLKIKIKINGRGKKEKKKAVGKIARKKEGGSGYSRQLSFETCFMESSRGDWYKPRDANQRISVPDRNSTARDPTPRGKVKTD